MEMLPNLKRLGQTIETLYQKKREFWNGFDHQSLLVHSCEVLTCSFSHFKRAEKVWNSPKVKSFLVFIFKSCRSQKQVKNLEIQENVTQEQELFSISQNLMFFNPEINLENKWKTAHLKPPKYFKSLLKHCCTDNTHDIKYLTLAL